MKTIPFQLPLRPEVRTVEGNADYKKFEKELHRIDELVVKGGVEKEFLAISVKRYRAAAAKKGQKVKRGHLARHQLHALRALRCTVLMCLLGEDYRGMSRRLAECPLFRWFSRTESLGPIRVPAKSTLHDYANWLPEEEMREIVGRLLRAAGEGRAALELVNDAELSRVWLDSTAVKTNIHFPIDWVLLRDAVRTLMKAVMLIRKHGLRSRMPAPEEFVRGMNRLSIEMTQSRRKSEAGRQRKKTLRRMKKQVKVVAAHAQRYRELLDREWEKTDWTRKQAEQVLRRLDGVLEQLPHAVKQAHERIIGARQVKNEDKLLSLYERETRVIVRGKADAEIEFGNKLLIAEQADGLIVDWRLYRDTVPADSRLLQSSIERIEKLTGLAVKAATTDRGFDSAENVAFLRARKTFDGICPKSPRQLRQRNQERRFTACQRRRGATEGRIGVFKNVFCGKPMRLKGFQRRELGISWRVLAHNLWVLARLSRADEEELTRAA